jgi:hypothetical protein
MYNQHKDESFDGLRVMKVAIVHDYIKEYGGAERVLEALTEAFPDAPIYTAFYQKGSPAYERFKHKRIRTSWVHYLPGFSTKLHSPLRFLAPMIWNGKFATAIHRLDGCTDTRLQSNGSDFGRLNCTA